MIHKEIIENYIAILDAKRKESKDKQIEFYEEQFYMGLFMLQFIKENKLDDKFREFSKEMLNKIADDNLDNIVQEMKSKGGK